MSDEATPTEDQKKTVEKKPALEESHPDLADRYGRISALFTEIHQVTGTGGELPPALIEEAQGLFQWTERLAADAIDDRPAFEKESERDRTTLSTALKLKGDPQLVRQLMTACEELRSLLENVA